MRIGIVGGGMMGVSLAYYLTQLGVEVDVYEASPTLGGLAAPVTLPDQTRVDRHYHVILSGDEHVTRLCQELGIEGQLRFRETKTGFFNAGTVYSMNNMLEFLTFPPLNWIDRFRLGLTVVAAQMIRDWKKLESIGVEEWLVRYSGRATFENIWRPLLRAKFDGSFDDTPATYIWARLVRMKSTRSGAAQKEQAGHLVGGYQALIEALARRITAAGGRVFCGQPVREIVIENGTAAGLDLGGRSAPYDAVISTLQVPLFARLIPGASPAYREFLGNTQYLGIVSGLLVLDRPLTGYWTLNITSTDIPFTGIIETTAYIDPQLVGGHHLVYLPKYTTPNSPYQQKADDEIRALWLSHLAAMFPKFDARAIRYFLVHREQYVEPLHNRGETSRIPPVQTPVKNLFLVTTAQIYPALTNSESIVRHTRAAAQSIADACAALQSGGQPSRPAVAVTTPGFP